VSETNKVMVGRIYEAIWNQQNLALVTDHFASDYLGHSMTEIQGSDGVIKWATTMFHTLRNGVFTIQDQIAEGDKVVTRWIACGANTRECEGLLATGKTVTITGIDIFRIANGKIIEGWSNANRQGVAFDAPTAQDKENSS
jgi:predicted ester cyclase